VVAALTTAGGGFEPAGLGGQIMKAKTHVKAGQLGAVTQVLALIQSLLAL
jgi:hypothetical protein